MCNCLITTANGDGYYSTHLAVSFQHNPKPATAQTSAVQNMMITLVVSAGLGDVSDSGTIRGTKIAATIKPMPYDTNPAAKQQKVRPRLDIFFCAHH